MTEEPKKRVCGVCAGLGIKPSGSICGKCGGMGFILDYCESRRIGGKDGRKRT